MKKRKFNQYKDGVLDFGSYKEKYNENKELLNEKEFIKIDKLFFSYKSIREEDRLKFDDTGFSITLKINTPYMNGIKTNHVILINGERYSIKYIDSDINKKNLYIYLSNYIDEMNTYISIYKKTKMSPIKNPTLDLFKNAWCKIENLSDKSTRDKVDNDVVKYVIQKRATLKYFDELDSSLINSEVSKYIIGIDGSMYKIMSSININNEKSLIQLDIEKV